MLWSERPHPTRRGLLLAPLAVAVAGCFRPMLAATGPAAAIRGRIALPAVNGREDYILRRRLEERLGTPDQPDLRLDVEITLRDQGLAVAQDSDVTRIMLTVNAPWTLVQPGADSRVLLRDVEHSQAGYNATPDLYASQITRRDIERRLLEDVAERIARRVLGRAGSVLAAAAA